MKTKLSFSGFILILFSINACANSVSVDEGKTIFISQCAACHNVNVKVVGPALADVDKRHSIEWIINFVHSSQTLVQKKDTSAVNLFKEFNNIVMPDHPDISAEQIKSIVSYIKSQTKNASAADAAPFARPGKIQPKFIPISIKNFTFFGIYIALLFIVVACFIVAVKVKELQRNKNEVNKI